MTAQPPTPRAQRSQTLRRTLFTLRQVFLLLVWLVSLVGPVSVPTPALASSCFTEALTATADTYLSAASPTANYGASTTLEIDRTTSTSRRTALLKWDLSSIPSYATVSSASITVYVTNSTTQAYNLYNLLRAWVEGSANWNTYDGTNTWGTSGASATSDRGNTNLWDTTVLSSGSQTRNLNTDGMTVVQGWIAGTTTNNGMIIQNYTSTTSNNLIISSKEATTPANRPILNVNYCVPQTITVTGTLSAFSSQPGVPSAAQTYTVSGSSLTADIGIAAPSGFELSTDGTNYSSNLTLPHTGGTVPTTTIYVRLNSAIEGNFSGNITHTSSGAATQNLAASGTVLYVYTLTVNTSGNGTVTLNPAGGSYNNGTVVTLTAVPNSGYMFTGWSGDLTGAANPATITMNGNKTVTASFYPQECKTDNLIAAEDTWMNSSFATYNYGGAPTLQINGGTGDQGALLKWNLAGIPATARVSSASITVNVTDTSNQTINLYNLRRAWVEGSNSGAAGSGASWNFYGAGTGSWGTPGAQHTGSDRYDTNLWGAGTSTFNTAGSRTVDLDADGLAVVQGWVDGSLANYGLTIQNYSASSANLIISSSEDTTEANKPKLNISYCFPITDPYIATTGTLSAFSTAPGVPSAAQTYTVAGSNLTDNILITAPTGFELSTDGATYASNLTLNQSSGSVPTTTIYVRLNSATTGSYSDNITHTSAGATTKNITASGSVVPYYTLTVNIVGGGSVALNPAGGSYASGTVVTLTPTPDSGYLFSGWSGALSGSTNPAPITMDGDKTVTATFLPGTCTTANLTATEDNYISAVDVTYNNGGNTEIHVNVGTTAAPTSRRTALLRWDLSSIPSNATVSAASLSLYVSNTTTQPFYLYAMRRSWVEGTSTQAASSTSANWNTYDGVNSWGTAGVANTGSDRYDTNLWDTTALSSTGSQTRNLNTDGVAVVQGWIAGTTTNYGLTMQNYASLSSADLYFTSREGTTAANRPKLNISYCAFYVPTITTTGTLAAFIAPPGVPSAAQTYTVAGSYLDADIAIAAPSGFELSTDGTTYSSGLTLTQSGGVVATTTIYVRLNSATEGAYSGDIAHTSTGATTKNVAASGSVVPYYTLAATASPSGAGSVALSPAGGSYPSGTTVTLTPTANTGYAFDGWSGANAGDIVNTGGVYTIVMNANKSVTANFAVNLCTDVSLPAVEDNWLRGSQATTNYGGATTLSMNANGINSQVALLRWDLSSLPAGATIDSASLTVYVTDASPTVFPLYNLLRSWVEGTGTLDNTPSTTSSNWNTYNGVNNWGTAGAQNTTSDRGSTNLWAATALSTTGAQTRALNTGGLAVVQGWYATPASNYGLTIQNTATSSDYLIIASSEAATETQRPQLNVHYCVISAGPAITTGGTLSAFSTPPGVPSAAQTYTVAGSSLTENIVITPPAGFELSTDGTNYSSGLTLAQSGGSVPTTTVYVRLNSAGAGSFAGNIAHTSAGATTKNVAVSGTVAVAPITVTFQTGVSGYTGTVDTFLRGTTEGDTPFGDNDNLEWDENTGSTTDEIALLRFNGLFASQGGPIPDGATITSASLTYMTTDLNSGSTANGDPANVYESLVDWPGATVTYNNFGGEAGVQADEYNAALVASATATALSTAFTIDVTASLQRWASGTANYGWVFLPTAGDGVNIYSSDFATVAYHPLLSVSYQAPTITASGTLSAFSTTAGVPSAAQTYTVSGSGLAENIIITPPAGFEVSADGASYFSLLSLAQSGGTVLPTTVYVRLNAATEGSYGGDIAHTSAGAAAANLPASGTVAAVLYTLTLTTDGHGTVSLNPAGPTYAAGSLVTLTPVPNSGYAFATWSGADEEDPSDNGDGTWSLVMDGDKAITANFSLLPVNVAPNAPVLVQPAQAATGVGLPPTLQVTVSDPNPADTLDASFYGRAAGGAAGADFTLVVIPDSQNESTSYPAVLNTQFQWIADHKTSDNLVFATSVGDIVNTATSTTQYTNADGAYDRLDAAGVAYSVSPGNHDMGAGSLFNTYFGTARFAGKSWYGGYLGSDNYNNYSLFSASGNDFILINLQYSPGTTQLDWADALLKANPARRGIVVQHNILNTDNSWNSQASYTALKDNPNLFLMLCGHMHTSTDGAAYRAEPGDDGHTIHIVMADYQDYPNGGNGYLRLLRFSPANDKIYATTYSPSLPGSITSYPDQMEMVYDLANGSAAAYTLIGTANDVANGGVASVAWSGLAASTGYEWYTTVSDGTETVTGPTWSFTTGAANHTPVFTESDPQAVTMSEDGAPTAFSLTLHASDEDAGDSLTWSIAAPAAHGAASASGTGLAQVIGYTPDSDFNGTDSFTVQVSDGTASDSLTINVTVTAVNDAPVITGQAALSTAEDTALAITLTDLTVTDVDNAYPDGFTLTVLPGANYTLAGDTLTPAANYTGALTVPVVVNDGTDDSNTFDLAVTVTAVNDPPAATPQSVITAEDAAKVITLTGSDVEDSPLSFTVVTNPDHGVLSGTPPALTYTPAPDFHGADSFTFTASDGGLESTAATVSITVTPANDAPVLAGIGDRPVNELVELAFTAGASDVDQDPLAFSLASGAPEGAAIDPLTGAFTWTPAEAQGPGSYPVTVKVCDDEEPALCDEETLTITVGEVNTPPALDPIPPKSVAELTLLSFTITATDADLPEQTLTYSLANAPDGAAIDPASGVFTWTPAEEQGPANHHFNICASDGSLVDCEPVTVTVSEANTAPVIAESDPQAVTMSEDGAPTAFALTLHASDADGDTLTWSIATPAAHGVATADGSGASKDITYAPAANWNGSDSFVVQVSDGQGGSDTLTVDVTVNPVNDAPAANPQALTTAEDTPLAITLTGSDPEGSPLTFSVVDPPTNGALNGSVPDLTYSPAANFNGSDSFTFTANDGTVDSSPATVTITVIPANDAPVLAAIGDKSIAELVELAFTASASDVDGDALAFSLASGAPEGASINPVTGDFSWTPAEAQGPGGYPVTVKACDDEDPALCDEETITITVGEANTAPVLDAIGNKLSDELVELTFTATATDGDLPENMLTFSLVDAPSGAAIDPASGAFTWTPGEAQGPGDYPFEVCVSDGALDDCQPLTVSVSEANTAPVLAEIEDRLAAEGVLLSFTASATDADLPANSLTYSLTGAPAGAAIAAGGAFTWTPGEDQGGAAYTFDVCVSDGALNDCDTLTVTVNEVNTAPLAADQSGATTAEETALAGSVTATDADGNPLTYAVVAGPAHGSLSLDPATGAFTYTPTPDFNGGDSFTFKANDGLADSNTASVSITVTPVNDAPVITGQAALSTPEETALAVALDDLTVTDVDNTYPAGFTLSVLPGEQYALVGDTLTPEADFNGTLTVPVKVNDGDTDSNTFNLAITVTPVNDAPAITGQVVLTTPEETALAIALGDLTVTDVDNTYPAGFTLSVLPGANYTLAGNTFTPATNYNGTLTVPVVVNDGDADSNTYNLSVTVTAVNDAPVCTAVSLATDEDTLGQADPACSDADGDELTYTIVDQPTHGAASVVAGALAYAPQLNFNGADSFTYQASDGTAGSAAALVTVAVAPVNDAPIATGQSVVTMINTTIGITLGASDVENDPLTFAIVDGPDHGALTGDAPDLTYTPAAGYSGNDSFTFIANDGTVDSQTATVALLMSGYPPPLPSTFHGEVHISDNPPAAGALVEAYVPGVSGPVSTTPIGANGTDLVYLIDVAGDLLDTPTKDGGVEADVITFKVGSRVVAMAAWHGGTNIELTIHPPQALPGGPYTGFEGSAISFSGSANDWGSDALTYQWDWENDGTYDTTGAAPSHTWSTAGTNTVALKVTDAQGGEGAATATVTVSNAAPVLAPIGDQTVAELEALSFTASATDSDLLVFSLVGAPAGASITPAGAFTWTPDEAQGPGSYPFTVKVCDNRTPAACDEEPLTVTVSEANATPALDPVGNKSVPELSLLSFTATATDTDLPANSLTFSLANGAGGNVPEGAAITSGGVFTWTPSEAQGPGAYTFDVCVSDGAAGDCETITVSVSEANTAPVLGAIGNQTIAELATLSFTASATDGDLPADSLTFSLADGAGGSVPEGASLTTGGAFTWAPTEAQGPGTYTFDVCVSDGDAGVCETITVTVSEANLAPLAADQSQTTAEDTALNGQLVTTDGDLPTNPLTYAQVSGPAYGALTVNSDGSFIYTPAENYHGPDSFTFKANDGTADSNTATVSITVTRVNDAPACTVPDLDTAEDTPAQAPLPCTDADGDPLALVIVVAPQHGALSLVGGQLVYTPDTNYFGEDGFSFAVSDGTAQSGNVAVTLAIAAANDAPVAADQAVPVVEDTSAAITLSATDVDGDTLTYTIVDGPDHGVLSGDAPALTYTPAAGYSGPDSFTFKANDGTLDSNTATVSITVGAVNDAPTATPQALTTPEDTALAIVLGGSDPENSALSFTVVTQPAHGTLTGTLPDLTYTPAANYNGPDTFTFTASDGELTSPPATIAITVTPVNDAPVLAGIGDRSVNELVELAFIAFATDVDGDTLTFSLVAGAPEGASITTGGAFTWTPAEAQGPGSYPVTIQVCDNALTPLCDDETIAITVGEVNTSPALPAIADQGVVELALLTFTVTATDADLPVQTLTYSLSGAPTGAAIGENSGVFTWTPAEEQGPGEYTFNICAGDGGLVDCEPVKVTVGEANLAPALGAIGNQLANELAELSFTATATDGDLPANPLTFTLADGAGGSVPAGAGITTGGAFTWTPSEAQGPGAYTFDVCVSDGAASDCETITVTVSEVNLAPVITESDPQAVAMSEDGDPNPFSLTLHATDADGNPLTWSIATPASSGTATVSGTGPSKVIDYAPTADFNGSDSFVVQVSDGIASASLTVNVTVEAVNDAPAITGQVVLTTPEETALTISLADLTVTDVDNTYPAGFTLSVLPGANYTLAGNTLTPAANYNGTLTVPVVVNDGAADSNTFNLAVTVTAVNDAPVCTAVSLATDEDTPGQAGPACSDADGDELTYTIVDQPTHGAASVVAGALAYAPQLDFNGADSFTYQANDGTAGSAAALVTVTVAPVNDAPVAADQSVATDEDIAKAITLAAADVDGDILTYTVISGPAHGALSGDAPDLTYTPTTDYSGPDSFTFKASDGTADSNTATVSITVGAVNDPPSANDQPVAVTEDIAKAITLTGSDPENSALTFTVASQPTHGVLSGDAPDLTYTPALNYNGPDSFTFTVSDGTNTSPAATVSITVNAVNDAPELNTIGSKSVNELNTLSFNASAANVDNDSLTYSLANGAPAGASITTGGAFTWTPDETQGPQTYTFDVCVTDGELSDCETITVTVSEVTVSHNIALVAGWNLVSFNVHPNDTAIASVLASIAGNYDLVYAWDSTGAHAGDGNWLKYAPALPPFQNTLTHLDEKMGFWIRMTAADTLEVSGTATASIPITLSTAAGGWNLVGYPAATNGAMPAVLRDHGVGTDFSLVFAYHANDPADLWKLFDSSAPLWANDLKELAPGWGYWVYVTADHDWTVSYAQP